MEIIIKKQDGLFLVSYQEKSMLCDTEELNLIIAQWNKENKINIQ